MASFRCLRVVALLVVAASLTAFSLAQNSALHVNESQIKFRLDAHPVLELPIVNTSGKAVVGEFRLELLNTNDKIESFVTGTFSEEPGTTVEKVAWPLNYLTTVSPSSLGWRRLHYTFTPRPEYGIAPCEGIVQLSRVLVGLFEVRMTAASKAKPGSKFPVRVRVDDPSTGKALRGTKVELTLGLGDDDTNIIKHTVINGTPSVPTSDRGCALFNAGPATALLLAISSPSQCRSQLHVLLAAKMFSGWQQRSQVRSAECSFCSC